MADSPISSQIPTQRHIQVDVGVALDLELVDLFPACI
jgi:hypothetical protein